MDGRRFDELSKLLGTKLTRSRFFNVLSALGMSGLTLSADAVLGRSEIRKLKKKGGNAGNHKKRKRRNRRNDCPENRKNAVCHCPPGLGGRTCFVICVGTGGGHDNDEFDCMCSGKIPGVPDCVPGRCPADFPDTRGCDVCIPDGSAAAGTCCSGTSCAATGLCGACTCASTCAVQSQCTGLGVANCRCRTLDSQCGPCIPDGDAAGSGAECCSGEFCPGAPGVCGSCACPGPCNVGLPCADRATNCLCRTSGQCGPCIVDGRLAGSAAECCSRNICGPICGLCPPLPPSGGTGGPGSTGDTGGSGSSVCTPPGDPCREDAECCGQRRCFQGKCGEKNSHCHHDRECAKGYRCVGGRSIGSHRRCRKTGS
jgi:hypothetical protein